MQIPLYVLGLLVRFGPQHGYQIRKGIAEELADFARIKLPTIYYHLQRMERQGLLRSSTGPAPGGPDKTTYAITAAGERAFRSHLRDALAAEYLPAFPLDAALYFSSALPERSLVASLQAHAQRLERALTRLRRHRTERLSALPEKARTAATLLFRHHEHHYQAELGWAREALEALGPASADSTRGERA